MDPTSVLQFLEKVRKMVIGRRLSRYYTKFITIPSSQIGFRPAILTDKALAFFVDSIKIFVDKENYAGSVFLDLSKAFSSLDHNIRCTKLVLYGIAGQLLQLLKASCLIGGKLFASMALFFQCLYQERRPPRLCFPAAFIPNLRK